MPALEAIELTAMAEIKDEKELENHYLAAQDYLAANAVSKPDVEVERDEVNEQTILKRKSDVLVYLLRLKHTGKGTSPTVKP